MALTSGDYTGLLQALLPPGPAWPVEDSQTSRLCEGLAIELARIDARADRLVEEADPRTTSELLPDWERVAGLPETCPDADAHLTVVQRRALLVAKLISQGGQSPQYYIDVAAALGFAVTVTEFFPTEFGDYFGDTFNGVADAFHWQINAAETTQGFATFGDGEFGDRFSTWGNALLECVIRRLAPAHTILTFSYS